jgi:hypothetical protein
MGTKATTATQSSGIDWVTFGIAAERRNRSILKDRHARIIIACPRRVILHQEAGYIYAD